MNLSVGVVAFLVSLVLIMSTADSATSNRNPSFRDQARLGANKPQLANKPPLFNKPSLERQASSNIPFEPVQTLNQVNEGVAHVSQATPVPLAVKIIQHVKELLQALNINIYNLANNLVLRIPVETRRNIVQGLGQIQSYILMILERANESKHRNEEKNRQQENSFDSPASVESNEIVNEDEMDASPTAPVDTEAVSDNDSQDEDDEEVKAPPPPPPPKALSKNQRRRLNKQNRQNSQEYEE